MLFDWLSASWQRLLLLFALTLFANFASTAPMSFRLTSSEVLPPGVFLRISPFLQKGGVLFGRSRDARV